LAVEQIWDSIAAKPSLVPVTAEQRTELERRLEAFDAEPGVGSSWAAVRRRVERRSRK